MTEAQATLARVSPLWNFLKVIAVGLAVAVVWVACLGLRDDMARAEVRYFPVLSEIVVCEDGTDVSKARERAAGVRCGDKRDPIFYPPFTQTSARCQGKDAVVSGTLSKVREAKFKSLSIGLGVRAGPRRRTNVKFLDQPATAPSNRPRGVGDWGPWVIENGCDTPYPTWFLRAQHSPWHHLWPLPSVFGPFPLPKPGQSAKGPA